MTEPDALLISWPTYGTWLPGPARGTTVDVDEVAELPEPDPVECAERRRGLARPVVELTVPQRDAVLADLPRIAALRRFDVLAVDVGVRRVHLLVRPHETIEDRPRLVQLVKGALARALSLHAGDPPAHDAQGAGAGHHRWWGRQYRLMVLRGEATVDSARGLVEVAASG